jgi:hypothetical protein
MKMRMLLLALLASAAIPAPPGKSSATIKMKKRQ